MSDGCQIKLGIAAALNLPSLDKIARQFYLLMNWTLFPLLRSIMTYETKAQSDDPHPTHSHIPNPVQSNGLG